MSEISPARGLRAALLLACGRVKGLDLIVADNPEGQRDAARRSFVALPLSLPIFLLLQALDAPAEEVRDPLLGALHDIAAFGVGWLGFAALSHYLAGTLGRAVLWPRFITLWNWCNVVQYLLLGAAALLALLGVPSLLAQTAWIAATGWALWLEWFATRLALGLPGPKAAAFVAVDLAIGLALVSLSQALG